MLGLEECHKYPASFTHKHSLQSSHLHDCKHKEKPNKASTEAKLWQKSTYVKKNKAEIKLK